MTCVACTGSSVPSTTFCGQCGQRVGAPIDVIDPMIGSVLDGRYLIESKIAAGGFGTVYRARSIEPGREHERFAVKVLLAQHSNDPSVSARFRREAITMSSLANRHTVTTLELNEDRAANAQFIVMELLEGESLQDRFTACGQLHWRSVLRIVRAVCESLAEAHALGIVHRDLKPANIFLTHQPRDFVKVLDFGIAKILQGSNMFDGNDLTRIGQAIGTLEYMSPEQLIGGELDNRTDLYTLGVVAYEMIVGRRPFADVTGATGLVTALMTRRPPPPSTVTRGPLPAGLDGMLLRCLERDPQDRYADVHELAFAVDQLLAERDDLFTTQRQWNRTPPARPAMLDDGIDQEDELTWVDAAPPFELPRSPSKPASKPPVDERRITPRAAMVEVPVAQAFDHDAVVRAQIDRAPQALAPRGRRAHGTGVPFLDTSTGFEIPADERTGARPLYATEWAVGTEATAEAVAPRRFPVGSSPVIEDVPQGGGTVAEPVEASPVERPASRLGALRVVAWAIGLAATGLGIGAAIALVAGS